MITNGGASKPFKIADQNNILTAFNLANQMLVPQEWKFQSQNRT